MITKSKIIVLAVLFAVLVFFILRVVEERAERQRMIADRITMRYGALMAGIAADSPYGEIPIAFATAVAGEIAARLGLRPAFFHSSWDAIFDEFDTGIYDIIIYVPPAAPRDNALSVMIPLRDSFIAITASNERLAGAVSRAAGDMLDDGTVQGMID